MTTITCPNGHRRYTAASRVIDVTALCRPCPECGESASRVSLAGLPEKPRLAVTAALAMALVPAAQASAAGPPVPNGNHPVACKTWALQGKKSERKRRLAECIRSRRMSQKARRCLVAGGITTAGVVVGGVIGGAAARAIAGGIVGGGGGACVAAILSP